jgi:hypothetical protein
MKNVVMIAYGFPPEGNAGAYRPLRFVRQLPNFGWTPTVISAVPSQYERFDAELLRMVPNGIEVLRIEAFDPWQAFQAWRSSTLGSNSSTVATEKAEKGQVSSFRTWVRTQIRYAESWWYHPDMAAPWIKPAVRTTVKVCLRNQSSVIWATAGPVSSFYVARLASRKVNLPYILDFRDAFTIVHNEFESRRPAWAIRRDRKKMFELLHDAQAVIFRYEAEAECFWRAYEGALDATSIYIIPNGFESPVEESIVPAGDKCTILYAGTLPEYRYDTLLTALSFLKRTDTNRIKHLRLRFIGEGTEVLASEAAALGLSDIIETAGPKSYTEVATLQREAHALLMLGRKPTHRGYELFAGAKLFGYLKAGRPIVGVLPEDETKRTLHRVGAFTVADVSSAPKIVKVLRDVIDNWSMGTLSKLVPDRKACEAYSSERQTATLVRALEGLPSEEPFIPGAQAIPPSLRDVIENTKWLDGG